MRTVPLQVIKLIKQFEGLRLFAYPDPATGNKPWTIGYGHTGPDVVKGLKIDLKQADKWLYEDLERFGLLVDTVITVPLNDNQYSALVSLAFNIGPGNFRLSTLRRLLNEENYEAASKEFIRWNKAAGKVLDGLTRRREAEARLFKLVDSGSGTI